MTLLSKDTKKTRKTTVDYGYSSNGVTTIYSGGVPRVKKNALNGILGYYYQQVTQRMMVENNQTSKSITELASSNSSSMALGLSNESSLSYKVVTDRINRSYWRMFNVYGLLTYAVSSKEDYYTYSSTTFDEINNSNHIKASVNPVGFRIGTNYHMGFKNSSTALAVGLEVGQVPGYSIPASNLITQTATESTLVMIKVGLTIGSSLKSL